MDIQPIINSRAGISLGFTLGKIVPPGLGSYLAGSIGRRLARQKNLPMVQAIRSNLWMATGQQLNSSDLDRIVEAAYTQNARNIFQFYRNFRNAQALEDQVEFPQVLDEYQRQYFGNGIGLIVVGVHLSNFDLVLQALARQAVKRYSIRPFAIAAPEISKGYGWQNEFRRQSGLDIEPASMYAVREASERLKNGGIVVSGLDRPVPDGKYHPKFFGHSASVPVLHVPLALQTHAPVLVMGALQQPDGRFKVMVSEPVVIEHRKDRTEQIISNAERTLSIAEYYIRQAPDQWFMPYPIWPDKVAVV